MSIIKNNVTSYFSVGDLIEDENGADPIRITAINDNHVQVEVAASGELQISYEDLSKAADALNSGDSDSSQPLNRLASEYLDRHEEAIDAMWRRAGACQLP